MSPLYLIEAGRPWSHKDPMRRDTKHETPQRTCMAHSMACARRTWVSVFKAGVQTITVRDDLTFLTSITMLPSVERLRSRSASKAWRLQVQTIWPALWSPPKHTRLDHSSAVASPVRVSPCCGVTDRFCQAASPALAELSRWRVKEQPQPTLWSES